MKPETGYVIGFMSLALALFLGSKLSPNYLEFVSDGNNFLLIILFGICVWSVFSLIDFYYEKKAVKRNKGVKKR